MSKEERYVGNFIESSDMMTVPPVRLTIAGVTPPNTKSDSAGKVIKQPIIAFKETDKALVCGKTNIRCIKADHGSKPESWIGKTITLTVRYLREAFGEKNVPTLRIIPNNPVPMGARKFMGYEKPLGKEGES